MIFLIYPATVAAGCISLLSIYASLAWVLLSVIYWPLDSHSDRPTYRAELAHKSVESMLALFHCHDNASVLWRSPVRPAIALQCPGLSSTEVHYLPYAALSTTFGQIGKAKLSLVNCNRFSRQSACFISIFLISDFWKYKYAIEIFEIKNSNDTLYGNWFATTAHLLSGRNGALSLRVPAWPAARWWVQRERTALRTAV